jgi:predicted PhzF superfamily epimerase YddE/YHI9
MDRPLPCHLQILQGAQAGRPSRLQLDVDAQRAIAVSGEVVELGRGRLSL